MLTSSLFLPSLSGLDFEFNVTFFLFLSGGTRFHVAEVGLELFMSSQIGFVLLILLLSPCKDYRCAPPHRDLSALGITPKTLSMLSKHLIEPHLQPKPGFLSTSQFPTRSELIPCPQLLFYPTTADSSQRPNPFQCALSLGGSLRRDRTSFPHDLIAHQVVFLRQVKLFPVPRNKCPGVHVLSSMLLRSWFSQAHHLCLDFGPVPSVGP